jgi:hypothetical protein
MLAFDNENTTIDKASMADLYLDTLELQDLSKEATANILFLLYEVASYYKNFKKIEIFDEADFKDLCEDLICFHEDLSPSLKENFAKEEVETFVCNLELVEDSEEFIPKKHFFRNIKSLAEEWIERANIMGRLKIEKC